MQIHGFNKLTLLDYPGHLAAILFLGGCNMRCPFCHNASLVINPSSQPVISVEEILASLKKRTGILEGVCISGGEPTIYAELPDFIHEIKALGYHVKLDTNGSNPGMIKALVNDNLIDYIAMDIKNSREKYVLTAGSSNIDIKAIEESVDFLLTSPLEYEFRTTVVKEFHTDSDVLSIGNWLKGAKAYYLQPFKDSGDIISEGFTSPSKDNLVHYLELLKPFIEHVSIRGLD